MMTTVTIFNENKHTGLEYAKEPAKNSKNKVIETEYFNGAPSDTVKDYDNNSYGQVESKDIDPDDFTFHGGSIAATSNSSRASSVWRELHEINLLIQEKPKAKFSTFLMGLILLNSALILGGTLTLNTYASNLVDQNKDIAVIMRDSTLRLYYYLEIHRRVRIISMISNGLISNSFTTTQSFVQDYTKEQMTAITEISKIFSSVNTLLIDSMHLLDQSLINQLFSHVTLHGLREEEPDVIVPISSAAYEYMQAIVSLQTTTDFKPDDIYVQFILKNTLNDILIRSEEIPQVLLNAVRQLNDNVQNILFYLIITLVVIMTLLIVSIIHIELRYIREKGHFVYMIMRCDDKEIEPTISLLKDFILALGSKVDGIYTQISDISLRNMKNGENEKKGKKTVKRVNTKTINNASYLRVFISVGFLMIALAPLLSSILLFQKFIQDINKLDSDLIANDNLLSKYVLVYIGIYEYISMNQTSLLRGQPITRQLDADLSLIKQQFEFFSTIKTGDEANDGLVSQLMKGNLCEFFRDSLQNDYDLCVSLGEGSATSGLFGITSYMTRIVNRRKLEFDESDKSSQIIAALLNAKALREVEILFDIIFELPFFRIDSILIDSIRIRTDTFQLLAKWINAVCIIVTLFFGALGFKVYYFDGLSERKDFRMILKLFPVKLVKAQGKIRNYISSERGNMFDS